MKRLTLLILAMAAIILALSCGKKTTFVTIDGTKIADITVPGSFNGQDARGFYNLEILFII